MPLRGRNKLTDEHIFFVTTTVKNFIPVFKDEKYCSILINNIKYYQIKHEFKVLGYVIMPTHFHWIVLLGKPGTTISAVMRDIKKYSAWDLLEVLEKEESKYFKIFISNNIKEQKRQFWIHRFDDVVIRDDKTFWRKLKYIHNNPVKEGLVEKAEDYKFSSAANYILGDNSVIEVDIGYIGAEL